MLLPNCKVFSNNFCYVYRNHEEEGPVKILATLEIVCYISFVGLVKDPKWTRTPPGTSKWPQIGGKSSLGTRVSP